MPLVLLDRDGVINEDSPHYIRNVSQWFPIRGSLEAISRLARAGHMIAVCSNQSAVGRGLVQRADLEAIDRAMTRAVELEGGRLDGIYYCLHAPEDNCQCRKPAPGLLRTAMDDLQCRLDETTMIGDSLRDIQAALAIGCRALLVRTGNGRHDEESVRALGIDAIFDDLAGAADWMLSR